MKDCQCVAPIVAATPTKLLISVASPEFKVDTFNVPKIVLLPAKDCVPVLTTPPLVAFAGAKLKTPEVMLAPFAVDVLVMVPTEIVLPPPVLAMVIDPFPFVIEIPEPAESVAFDKVFPTVFPINS